MPSSDRRFEPDLVISCDSTLPSRLFVARNASVGNSPTNCLIPAPGRRSATRWTVLCITLATTTLFAPITQSADNVAREVVVEGRSTFTARDLSKVPTGENSDASVTEIFIVQEINPESGFSNLGGYCVALSQNKKGGGFVESASCVLRDIDGDALYETDYTTGPGGGVPGHGKGTITGGTGKFAGVSGESEWDSHFYASPTENVYQGGGYYKATWRWPAL